MNGYERITFDIFGEQFGFEFAHVVDVEKVLDISCRVLQLSEMKILISLPLEKKNVNIFYILIRSPDNFFFYFICR